MLVWGQTVNISQLDENQLESSGVFVVFSALLIVLLIQLLILFHVSTFVLYIKLSLKGATASLGQLDLRGLLI